MNTRVPPPSQYDYTPFSFFISCFFIFLYLIITYSSGATPPSPPHMKQTPKPRAVAVKSTIPFMGTQYDSSESDDSIPSPIPVSDSEDDY